MILRDFRDTDADVVCTWLRSETELYQWSADRFCKFPLTGQDIVSQYRQQTADGRFIPLTAEDGSGRICGHLIIRYPHADDSTVRFGFVILDPDIRGQGRGRELLRLAVCYAADRLHAKRADLGVFENNPGAVRCYEAVGFRVYQRRDAVLPVGTWAALDMELLL